MSSGNRVPQNSLELIEQLRRALNRPHKLDPFRTTIDPDRPHLKSGAASPRRRSDDPIGDAIRKRLGISRRGLS